MTQLCSCGLYQSMLDQSGERYIYLFTSCLVISCLNTIMTPAPEDMPVLADMLATLPE